KQQNQLIMRWMRDLKNRSLIRLLLKSWSIHAYSWQESNFSEFSLQGAFEHIRETRMTRKFQRMLPKAGTAG
ncbi:MAG: hypothetical protein KC652_27260, partial [Cyanobacteria bacterium HKST-UBA01]|nr:hypothetical protein [Cyanobacteria bacterium HKST-UBA01]